MNWAKWDIHHRRWQDIVAFFAGIWLIAMVPAQIAAVTFISGWLAFIGGALVMLMSAAALGDDDAIFSWVAAVGGLVAVIGSLVAFFNGHMLAFGSLMLGGGVALFLEVWSGALKRREHGPVERRIATGRVVRT